MTLKKTPLVAIVCALLFSLFLCFCGNSESPSEQREQNSLSQPTKRNLWDRHCRLCHSKQELAGHDVDSIRQAIKIVPSMRRFSKLLTENDLRELADMLAEEEPAEEQRPTKSGESDQASADYTYQQAEKCQRCHPDQVRQWEHSLHALAHSEVVYDYAFIKASIETNQQIETFCATCHTPLGVHDKTIPFAKAPRGPGDTRVSAVAEQGVQCDFCHTITGHTKLRDGNYILRPSKKMLGPFEAVSSTFHDTEQSDYYRSSEYCGSCHNVTHPDNGIVLEATFSEWKASPYAREGVSCQDCHMTDGLFQAQKHPGKAAKTGPSRDHISKHYFVGPNILFANSEEAAPLRELSLKLLKGAATIAIREAKQSNKLLKIPVDVTNTGAGHYFPTGVTEIRELWLDVRVADADGTVLFHLGALDKNGNLTPGSIVYKTDVLDKRGNVTTKFWNTVKKQKDYRLPPRETLTEQIEVPMEKLTGKGPLTIKAALNYRTISPAGLAEIDVPPGTVEVPTITVCEASSTLSL